MAVRRHAVRRQVAARRQVDTSVRRYVDSRYVDMSAVAAPIGRRLESTARPSRPVDVAARSSTAGAGDRPLSRRGRSARGRVGPVDGVRAITRDDPLEVVQRRELHDDPALGPAEVDLAPGSRTGRRAGRPARPAWAPPAAGAVVGRGSAAGWSPPRARSPRPCAPTCPRRRSAAPAAPGRRASSRPSSARACPAESTPAATRRWTSGGSLQQPQGVGDLRPGPADPAGELVVGAAEVLQQLVVGRRLLERVELAAVQVLQQRVAQHGVVAGVPDDRRDRGEAGLPGGPPPPLPHDQLVAVRRRAAGPRPAAAGRPRAASAPARPAPPPRRPSGAGAGSA